MSIERVGIHMKRSTASWLISCALTIAIFVYALFNVWGLPYFQKNFTFGNMIVPFILFFFVCTFAVNLILIAIARMKDSSKPSRCDICGNEAGTKENTRHKAKDGHICNDCYVAAGLTTGQVCFASPIAVIKEQIGSEDGLSLSERTVKYEKDATLASAMAKVKADARNIPSSIETNNSAGVKCPKCGSTQISADKKGFGAGKAVVGAAIAGPIGLAAGNIGAKRVRVTCLKCGNQWMAGKA